VWNQAGFRDQAGMVDWRCRQMHRQLVEELWLKQLIEELWLKGLS
jgi:hypothetical protein